MNSYRLPSGGDRMKPIVTKPTAKGRRLVLDPLYLERPDLERLARVLVEEARRQIEEEQSKKAG